MRNRRYFFIRTFATVKRLSLIHISFWLSNIAYSIYALLLVSAISLIFIHMKRKHRRLLLQQKRDMETVQQHEIDEAKLRFFTNVSHDLRTPLSLIITPLEQILATNTAQDIKKDLKLIHRNELCIRDSHATAPERKLAHLFLSVNLLEPSARQDAVRIYLSMRV